MNKVMNKENGKFGRIVFPVLIALVILWAFLYWLSSTPLVDYRMNNSAKMIIIPFTLIHTGWAFVAIFLSSRTWQKIVAGLFLAFGIVWIALIFIGMLIVASK